MSEVGKLTVSTRASTGKGPARKLRATGAVPGVLYGASAEGRIDPISIVVDVKALRAALDPVRKQNTVIDLTVEPGDGDGAARRTFSALLREYQVDPIRRDVTHVDLVAIDPTKEVVASIPLEFVGKHAGAIHGAQLHTVLREVEVRCKPAEIPVKLTVDVSPLEIGDVLHVSDIPLPEGVQAVTGLGQAVISCVAPEVEKATAAAEAAPEAAAGDKKDAKAPAGKAAPAAAPAAKGGKK